MEYPKVSGANINGYLVMRKPDQNYDMQWETSPQLGGTFYSGVDRMAWFDVDEDFYAERLPPNMLKMKEGLDHTNRDLTGIRICQDLAVAKQLLNYGNRESSRNELIAIYSEELSKYKGIVQHEKGDLEFLGYDFKAVGEWSLIASGIFVDSQAFTKWLPELNQYGLFSSTEHLHKYAEAYLSAAEQGQVEPLGSDPIVVAIKIFRVINPNLG